MSSCEEPVRRNLRFGVGHAEPDRELPHRAQAARPGGRLHPNRCCRPAERQRSGDMLGSLELEEVHETAEGHSRLVKLRPEGPPDGDELTESVPEVGHWSPHVSGHGRATSRKASKATLA